MKRRNFIAAVGVGGLGLIECCALILVLKFGSVGNVNGFTDLCII